MRFLRPAAALGAVAATLAFAGSAMANPSTPPLDPISSWVCADSINVSWSPSSPDQGAAILGYQFTATDLTSGGTATKVTTALSVPLHLVANHKYVVSVRAIEIHGSQITFSAWSTDVFTHTCLRIPNQKLYVAYNPDEGCIMCGLTEIYQNDPIVEKQLSVATISASLKVRALEVDDAGVARLVTG